MKSPLVQKVMLECACADAHPQIYVAG